MTTYSIYLATPRNPGFAWQAEDVSLNQLNLAVPVASGLSAVLSLARTIDAEEIPGRKLAGEAWIASGTRDQLLELIEDNGWEEPADVETLPAEGLYLVGCES